jgi:hypothetical protein
VYAFTTVSTQATVINAIGGVLAASAVVLSIARG